MKKIISLAMAGIMLFSVCPFAHATAIDYDYGTQVEYKGVQNEAYTVTVPAKLAPGNSGDVTAEGTWASNRVLVVSADEDVVLTNSINTADTKTLKVSFGGIELLGSNTEVVSETKEVSVDDIDNAIFGTWSGTFYYNVEMQNSFYGHEYVGFLEDEEGKPIAYTFNPDGSAIMTTVEEEGVYDEVLPAGTFSFDGNVIWDEEYDEMFGVISDDNKSIDSTGYYGIVFELNEGELEYDKLYRVGNGEYDVMVFEDGRVLLSIYKIIYLCAYQDAYYQQSGHMIKIYNDIVVVPFVNGPTWMPISNFTCTENDAYRFVDNAVISYDGTTFYTYIRPTNDVVIPYGVTKLDTFAFNNAENLNITMPTTVINAGNSAFTGAENVTIYYEGTEEQWIENDLSNEFHIDNDDVKVVFLGNS